MDEATAEAVAVLEGEVTDWLEMTAVVEEPKNMTKKVHQIEKKRVMHEIMQN